MGEIEVTATKFHASFPASVPNIVFCYKMTYRNNKHKMVLSLGLSRVPGFMHWK